MSTAVVSYSFTGNNEALASAIAQTIAAEHIRITEPKQRTNGTIAADIIFGRTPRVSPPPEMLDSYDNVIFVAPVWMGQPAFPLKTYWASIKKKPRKYGFISISGGSMGPNPGLKDKITKMAGIAPEVFLDMHIADLLPKGTKIGPKEIEACKLTAEDINKFAAQAIDAINRMR